MIDYSEYQEALQEVKTLLDDMTANEDESFKYHYYVHLKSIELLQNLVDLYPEYVKYITSKEEAYMSKEKYQRSLDEIGEYDEQSLSKIKDTLSIEYQALQELVDIYPEYAALKAKAVPMKPKSSQDTDSPIKSSIGICPSCDSFVMTSDYETENYCSNCGQAIDWSEDQ